MLMTDDSLWDLDGARVAGPLAHADAVCGTPLTNLLRIYAARQPNAPALVGHAGTVSYADLLRQAEIVACAIAGLVPSGQSVVCILPHTVAGIAGILGCLIAARPCVILNPTEPAERMAALLTDARPAALLVSTPLGFLHSVPTLLLDQVLAGPAVTWRPDQPWNPDAPAAIHFTSGSGGKPKGIVISFRSTLYRALDSATTWGLTPADAVLVTALPATGAGLSFLLGTLHAGARFLLANIGTEGISAVLRLASQECVTCAASGPALWRAMLQADPSAQAFRALRVMRIGNAALPRADLLAWRKVMPPDCAILHTYASTEALVVAQWFVPTEVPDHATTLAAGLLQPSMDYALLDEDGRCVAPGAPGELVLRGPHLALGEWQDGRVVQGRLLPLPNRPGWRYFATGDVARVEPDGMLRVLGRVDRQVKINGVRVEPGEVEATLRAEPDVREAAVVVLMREGNVTMHGFVSAPGREEPELLIALRRRLAAALPPALRPTKLAVLASMPLLPGGKIAYNALKKLAEDS